MWRGFHSTFIWLDSGAGGVGGGSRWVGVKGHPGQEGVEELLSVAGCGVEIWPAGLVLRAAPEIVIHRCGCH